MNQLINHIALVVIGLMAWTALILSVGTALKNDPPKRVAQDCNHAAYRYWQDVYCTPIAPSEPKVGYWTPNVMQCVNRLPPPTC